MPSENRASRPAPSAAMSQHAARHLDLVGKGTSRRNNYHRSHDYNEYEENPRSTRDQYTDSGRGFHLVTQPYENEEDIDETALDNQYSDDDGMTNQDLDEDNPDDGDPYEVVDEELFLRRRNTHQHHSQSYSHIQGMSHSKSKNPGSNFKSHTYDSEGVYDGDDATEHRKAANRATDLQNGNIGHEVPFTSNQYSSSQPRRRPSRDDIVSLQPTHGGDSKRHASSMNSSDRDAPSNKYIRVENQAKQAVERARNILYPDKILQNRRESRHAAYGEYSNAQDDIYGSSIRGKHVRNEVSCGEDKNDIADGRRGSRLPSRNDASSRLKSRRVTPRGQDLLDRASGLQEEQEAEFDTGHSMVAPKRYRSPTPDDFDEWPNTHNHRPRANKRHRATNVLLKPGARSRHGDQRSHATQHVGPILTEYDTDDDRQSLTRGQAYIRTAKSTKYSDGSRVHSSSRGFGDVPDYLDGERYFQQSHPSTKVQGSIDSQVAGRKPRSMSGFELLDSRTNGTGVGFLSSEDPEEDDHRTQQGDDYSLPHASGAATSQALRDQSRMRKQSQMAGLRGQEATNIDDSESEDEGDTVNYADTSHYRLQTLHESNGAAKSQALRDQALAKKHSQSQSKALNENVQEPDDMLMKPVRAKDRRFDNLATSRLARNLSNGISARPSKHEMPTKPRYQSSHTEHSPIIDTNPNRNKDGVPALRHGFGHELEKQHLIPNPPKGSAKDHKHRTSQLTQSDDIQGATFDDNGDFQDSASFGSQRETPSWGAHTNDKSIAHTSDSAGPLPPLQTSGGNDRRPKFGTLNLGLLKQKRKSRQVQQPGVNFSNATDDSTTRTLISHEASLQDPRPHQIKDKHVVSVRQSVDSGHGIRVSSKELEDGIKSKEPETPVGGEKVDAQPPVLDQDSRMQQSTNKNGSEATVKKLKQVEKSTPLAQKRPVESDDVLSRAQPPKDRQSILEKLPQAPKSNPRASHSDARKKPPVSAGREISQASKATEPSAGMKTVPTAVLRQTNGVVVTQPQKPKIGVSSQLGSILAEIGTESVTTTVQAGSKCAEGSATAVSDRQDLPRLAKKAGKEITDKGITGKEITATENRNKEKTGSMESRDGETRDGHEKPVTATAGPVAARQVDLPNQSRQVSQRYSVPLIQSSNAPPNAPKGPRNPNRPAWNRPSSSQEAARKLAEENRHTSLDYGEEDQHLITSTNATNRALSRERGVTEHTQTGLRNLEKQRVQGQQTTEKEKSEPQTAAKVAPQKVAEDERHKEVVAADADQGKELEPNVIAALQDSQQKPENALNEAGVPNEKRRILPSTASGNVREDNLDGREKAFPKPVPVPNGDLPSSSVPSKNLSADLNGLPPTGEDRAPNKPDPELSNSTSALQRKIVNRNNKNRSQTNPLRPPLRPPKETSSTTTIHAPISFGLATSSRALLGTSASVPGNKNPVGGNLENTIIKPKAQYIVTTLDPASPMESPQKEHEDISGVVGGTGPSVPKGALSSVSNPKEIADKGDSSTHVSVPVTTRQRGDVADTAMSGTSDVFSGSRSEDGGPQIGGVSTALSQGEKISPEKKRGRKTLTDAEQKERREQRLAERRAKYKKGKESVAKANEDETKSRSSQSSSPPSAISVQPPEQSGFEDAPTLPARPTVGGKTINLLSMQRQLEDLDDREESEESEEESEIEELQEPWDTRPTSPIRDTDALHWEYEIKRKTLAHNDIEEDMPWVVIGDQKYYNIEEANKAAYEECKVERDDLNFGMHTNDFRMTKDQHGMAQYFHSCDVGKFNVVVTRRLRLKRHGMRPGSKVGWLPKKAFDVKMKVVTKKEVPVPEGEGGTANDPSVHVPIDKIQYLEGSLYTQLSSANQAAMKIFLAQTTDSDSIIYSTLQEYEAEKKRLSEKVERLNLVLEQLREECDLDARTKLSVWVEEREIRGARNV